MKTGLIAIILFTMAVIKYAIGDKLIADAFVIAGWMVLAMGNKND